jgi:acetate kinase
VLTVNGGSSGIKFALFETKPSLRWILDGRIEGIASLNSDDRKNVRYANDPK